MFGVEKHFIRTRLHLFHLVCLYFLIRDMPTSVRAHGQSMYSLSQSELVPTSLSSNSDIALPVSWRHETVLLLRFQTRSSTSLAIFFLPQWLVSVSLSAKTKIKCILLLISFHRSKPKNSLTRQSENQFLL